MSEYTADISWPRGGQPFLDKRYSRFGENRRDLRPCLAG